MRYLSTRLKLSVLSLLLVLSIPLLGMSDEIPLSVATNSTAPQPDAQSLNCVICHEGLKTGPETKIKLPCTHEFHIRCLTDCITRFHLASQDFEKEFSCPTCRSEAGDELLEQPNIKISRTKVLAYLGDRFVFNLTKETLESIVSTVRTFLAHPGTLQMLQEAFHYSPEGAAEFQRIVSEHGLPKDLNELRSGDYIQRLRDIFPDLTTSSIANLFYVMSHDYGWTPTLILEQLRGLEGRSASQLLSPPGLALIMSLSLLQDEAHNIDENNRLIKAYRRCNRGNLLLGVLQFAGGIPSLTEIIKVDSTAGQFWDSMIAAFKAYISKAYKAGLISLPNISDAASADLFSFFDGSKNFYELLVLVLGVTNSTGSNDLEFQKLVRTITVICMIRETIKIHPEYFYSDEALGSCNEDSAIDDDNEERLMDDGDSDREGDESMSEDENLSDADSSKDSGWRESCRTLFREVLKINLWKACERFVEQFAEQMGA